MPPVRGDGKRIVEEKGHSVGLILVGAIDPVIVFFLHLGLHICNSRFPQLTTNASWSSSATLLSTVTCYRPLIGRVANHVKSQGTETTMDIAPFVSACTIMIYAFPWITKPPIPALQTDGVAKRVARPVWPRLRPVTEEAIFLLLVRRAALSEGEGASSAVVGGPSTAEPVPRRKVLCRFVTGFICSSQLSSADSEGSLKKRRTCRVREINSDIRERESGGWLNRPDIVPGSHDRGLLVTGAVNCRRYVPEFESCQSTPSTPPSLASFPSYNAMPERLPLEFLKSTASSPYLLASQPLIQSTSFARELDGLEYAWGLQRGDINVYFGTDDNTLQLDSSLLDSFKESHWLLAPTGETLDRTVDCYDRNLKRSAPNRISFYEVCPLANEYEYTIIPLCLSGPIFGKSASGESVSFADPFNDLMVTSRANPFFVAALAARYSGYEIEAPIYLTVALKLLRLFRGAYALVPLKFYEGSRPGDFGRELPESYCDLPLFASERSNSRVLALTTSSVSSSSECTRPFKCRKEDLSEEEDEDQHQERNSANVFKWMQDTKPSEFVFDTGNDKEIGSYALETPRKLVGNFPTDADAMWRDLVEEKGTAGGLHVLKHKRSPVQLLS
ncbi:uncharacterized protein BT62DRAFT_1011973 [Guyanagaster necrorhizus]|uniref:Uncharacterized protein n=1 Tax=Guyanagaster necrorhizus TaxID=856835 RepID=A0A9P7VHJ4_9AGAR|nr:uncharacterized protein BT62DRAFT_1011973 [Guyanagaster necrorhizus MCA 3950]KAG7441163.1 hypothetical protein BT62DRAFT_1011973 [Guyanagaster necrorhizus MCA 3950]